MSLKHLLILIAGCVAATTLSAATTPSMSTVLSKLQSMGGGVYSKADWDAVMSDLESIESQARTAGNWSALIEARIVRAGVLGDMRRDYDGAIALLRSTRGEMKDKTVAGIKRLFVREADMLAKKGDDAGVQRLIQEFRASPYYDPTDYPFSGGERPGVPLSITRPSADSAGSISEASMNLARTRAQLSAGSTLPDFDQTDIRGARHVKADYAGKVLLIDFWHKDWTAWQRDLPTVTRTYGRYHDKGLEMIGFSLEPDAAQVTAYAGTHGMTWPQVVGNTDLARKLGVFGESTTILVDRNGRIIGRDLRGSELVAAIKNALATP